VDGEAASAGFEDHRERRALGADAVNVHQVIAYLDQSTRWGLIRWRLRGDRAWKQSNVMEA